MLSEGDSTRQSEGTVRLNVQILYTVLSTGDGVGVTTTFDVQPEASVITMINRIKALFM